MMKASVHYISYFYSSKGGLYSCCSENAMWLVAETDTPSRSSWDEDDHVPAKKSSWDLPTPSIGRDSHSSDPGRRSVSRDSVRRPSSMQ